jgi:glyoxylase-like metal-dependent hydrolase (beta-lactamase superfamily II)
MRKIAPGVFLEKKFPGVQIGVIKNDRNLLLVDCPLRVDDVRSWLGEVADLGSPRYVVLMDHHPDRVLGTRAIDIPTIAHDRTRVIVNAWPDTFKGNIRPIGGECDQLKRITGVSKATPEISFSNETVIHLGQRIVRLIHKPGPMPGAIWLMLSDVKVLFIGDVVTKSEPPYFGEANLESWLDLLDELRSSAYQEIRKISSRDGLINRTTINDMARFLRRIPTALRKLKIKDGQLDGVEKAASRLITSYRIPAARRGIVLKRLQASLTEMHARMNPTET